MRTKEQMRDNVNSYARVLDRLLTIANNAVGQLLVANQQISEYSIDDAQKKAVAGMAKTLKILNDKKVPQIRSKYEQQCQLLDNAAADNDPFQWDFERKKQYIMDWIDIKNNISVIYNVLLQFQSQLLPMIKGIAADITFHLPFEEEALDIKHEFEQIKQLQKVWATYAGVKKKLVKSMATYQQVYEGDFRQFQVAMRSQSKTYIGAHQPCIIQMVVKYQKCLDVLAAINSQDQAFRQAILNFDITIISIERLQSLQQKHAALLNQIESARVEMAGYVGSASLQQEMTYMPHNFGNIKTQADVHRMMAQALVHFRRAQNQQSAQERDEQRQKQEAQQQRVAESFAFEVQQRQPDNRRKKKKKNTRPTSKPADKASQPVTEVKSTVTRSTQANTAVPESIKTTQQAQPKTKDKSKQSKKVVASTPKTNQRQQPQLAKKFVVQAKPTRKPTATTKSQSRVKPTQRRQIKQSSPNKPSQTTSPKQPVTTSLPQPVAVKQQPQNIAADIDKNNHSWAYKAGIVITLYSVAKTHNHNLAQVALLPAIFKAAQLSDKCYQDMLHAKKKHASREDINAIATKGVQHVKQCKSLLSSFALLGGRREAIFEENIRDNSEAVASMVKQ